MPNSFCEPINVMSFSDKSSDVSECSELFLAEDQAAAVVRASTPTSPIKLLERSIVTIESLHAREAARATMPWFPTKLSARMSLVTRH